MSVQLMAAAETVPSSFIVVNCRWKAKAAASITELSPE
jgi:predicted small metal-binding protein|eukprot:COSAG06_NODE_21381_length_759_cov_0.683333_2_plen_38_part_00